MLRQVKVENGIVRGLPAADPRITAFKGIPFAAPPVGENRWRAPQPAKDWDGVLKAYTLVLPQCSLSRAWIRTIFIHASGMSIPKSR